MLVGTVRLRLPGPSHDAAVPCALSYSLTVRTRVGAHLRLPHRHLGLKSPDSALVLLLLPQQLAVMLMLRCPAPWWL